MKRPPLNRYRKNIYSQHGEDGVIKEVLKRLEISGDDKWCVEFGAWDGKYLSNTFSLVKEGWNAVYIEGDKVRYKELLKTASIYKKIVTINKYISQFKEDINSLDNLLKLTKIPNDFEILSIDIDSYDLDVWESLVDFHPQIVIIETFSGVPPGVIWRHSPEREGNTFSAINQTAKNKGYTLICHIVNCFFVRNDLVSKIKLDKIFINNPELLFTYEWIPNKALGLSTSYLGKYVPHFLHPIGKRIQGYLSKKEHKRSTTSVKKVH